ncbi:MAG: hypothetical protein JNL95_04515 [Chitinophagales bacterium]|nr:hypothetical protein [Chitinophagales bacterium]
MIKKSILALLFAYLFCVVGLFFSHHILLDNTPPSDSYFSDNMFKKMLSILVLFGLLVGLGFVLRKRIVQWLRLDEVVFFHFLLYLLFYCIVGIWFLFKCKNDELIYIIQGSRKLRDPMYGYAYPRSSKRHEIVYQQDSLLLEVSYNFDSLGRRKTYCPSTHQSKSILFFGCSFTYGDGVNDRETLPSQYADLDSSVSVYNYAIDGWGPQQTYLQISKRNLSIETYSDTALGIYVWIDDHIKRAALYKSHYQGWTQFFPCFTLENNVLKYKGSFEKAYPLKGFLFELLNNSLFFKNIEIPSHETKQDYALVTALLKASRDRFSQQFKQGKFVVFIYPGSSGTIIPYLKAEKIDYVVGNSSLLNNTDFIPKHGHPNKNANRKIAKEIQLLIVQ